MRTGPGPKRSLRLCTIPTARDGIHIHTQKCFDSPRHRSPGRASEYARAKCVRQKGTRERSCPRQDLRTETAGDIRPGVSSLRSRQRAARHRQQTVSCDAIPGSGRKKLRSMLAGEQQELHQIEQGLRDTGSPRHGMGRPGVRAGAASPRQPDSGTVRSRMARTCDDHAGKHGRLGAGIPPGRAWRGRAGARGTPAGARYACSALAAAKLPPEVWSGHEHVTVLGAGRRAAARPG